jgi:hypothetical protein
MNKALSDLRSIGIFFNRTHFDFHHDIVTPENAIISALALCKTDFLMLQLVYTWLKHHHAFIHAEAMIKKIASIEDSVELAFLGGLLVATGDRRLLSVATRIPKSHKIDLNEAISKSLRIAADIGQTSYQPNFLAYGLRISSFDLESDKKFIPWAEVLKRNPFLYCRALFGTNWRADVAALLSIRPYNPYEISKILNCSYETAHRNHSALKEAGWPEAVNYRFRITTQNESI